MTAQLPTSSFNSWVELYDSDILAIEHGPLRYAQERAGKVLEIDRFTKDLMEQFAEIGLGVEVKVFTTEQEGVWAFEVEIRERLEKVFDFDRMVHEVTNNILEIPGQEKGFINTSAALNELAKQERMNGRKRKHG